MTFDQDPDETPVASILIALLFLGVAVGWAFNLI